MKALRKWRTTGRPKMTREEMEEKFTLAMRLLWELCEDEEAFNLAVDDENGGKYELDKSFDEYLCELGGKVRFVPRGHFARIAEKKAEVK